MILTPPSLKMCHYDNQETILLICDDSEWQQLYII